MSHCKTLLLIALLASPLPAEEQSLDRAGAEAALKSAWEARVNALKAERAAEMEKKDIALGDKNLLWEEKVFGEEPKEGHSLWISMHGGGGAPKQVNDQQWHNQTRLYKLEEGIYLAPRAPTDAWNMWSQGHVDDFFGRLIEDYVVLRGVNPNRVYLMGYSAGGDGVWQLAPRMADRFAAAAMMAGHPNGVSLLSLRNLPFALFVGGSDAAYNRNKVVAERGEYLDKLREADPEGYEHLCRVYEGLPHWMNGRDAEAVPWMAAKSRQTWPKKIVWDQSGVPHARFYWLSISKEDTKGGAKITAQVDGQTIKLTGDVPKSLKLRLSDTLLDLDQPVRVLVADKEVFSGKVARSAKVIEESLQERADPASAASAVLTVSP